MLLGPGQGVVTLYARIIGTNVTSAGILYRYTPPVVMDLSPNHGGGGTVVVVRGTDLGISLGGGLSSPSSSTCPAENTIFIGGVTCDVIEVRSRAIFLLLFTAII